MFPFEAILTFITTFKRLQLHRYVADRLAKQIMYMATSLTLPSPLRETEIGARIWQTQKERNWAILSGGTSCPEPIENYLWNLAKNKFCCYWN